MINKIIIKIINIFNSIIKCKKDNKKDNDKEIFIIWNGEENERDAILNMKKHNIIE